MRFEQLNHMFLNHGHTLKFYRLLFSHGANQLSWLAFVGMKLTNKRPSWFVRQQLLGNFFKMTFALVPAQARSSCTRTWRWCDSSLTSSRLGTSEFAASSSWVNLFDFLHLSCPRMVTIRFKNLKHRYRLLLSLFCFIIFKCCPQPPFPPTLKRSLRLP